MNQYIAPRSKLFGHLDTLAAIKRGEHPAPVNVEIDLSNRCSLGCSWCHFAYTHTKGPLAGKMEKPEGHIDGGDLMDKLLAATILEQLHKAGVKSVTWTGGGEPTLHPDFERITGMADMFHLEQGIYTHGGHITQDLAMRIKEDFTWAFISLDECTAETYKASKGVNRFDAACDGIRRLMVANGKATIGAGFLLHRNNFHQVPRMVELGHELGVDYVQFRPAIQFDPKEPGQVAESTAWVPWAIGHLNAYQGDKFVIADLDRFKMYAGWKGHSYPTCYWSALQTVITPNGKIWRCANKREHPDALLGDLSQEDFATIWARSSGPCSVDGMCRAMCRGQIPNIQLEPMMAEQVHGNFI